MHRLPEIFGADAYEFNPDRWLDNRINQKQAQGFGLYANLVTFADGPRGCIGMLLNIFHRADLYSTLFQDGEWRCMRYKHIS